MLVKNLRWITELRALCLIKVVVIAFFAITGLILTFSGAASQSPPSYWLHNGSVVKLISDGETREFYYWEPRMGMRQVGVREGTLLFKGVVRDGTYSGTAYIFNLRCEHTAADTHCARRGRWRRTAVRAIHAAQPRRRKDHWSRASSTCCCPTDDRRAGKAMSSPATQRR
jgi:hypothetical protein